MNRVLNWLKKTPILIPFFFLLFLYLPSALLLPPEVDRNAIVTAVGIDKEGEDYSMSFLRFVPQANLNYSEKLEVITCKGRNVSENLEKASVLMGKNINLNHVESIVLGSSVLEEDISKILDFFARTPIVLSGCLLSATNRTAKEIIESVNALNTESGLRLEDVLRFTEQNYYGRETTLETFFSGYYSPTGTSFLSYVEMIEGESDGLNPSTQSGSSGESGGSGAESSGGESGESSGGSSSTQQTKKQKLFSNNGSLVLMKRGKKQTIMTREDIAGLNYVKSNTGKIMLTIPDYDLGDGKLGDIIYEVAESRSVSSVDFENNIPVVSYHVELKLDLFEIVDKITNEKQSIKQYDMDEEITKEIEKIVKQEFFQALTILRETKTDALELYETLQKADRIKFQKFLNSLESKEDFISHVVFAISVESDPF